MTARRLLLFVLAALLAACGGSSGDGLGALDTNGHDLIGVDSSDEDAPGAEPADVPSGEADAEAHPEGAEADAAEPDEVLPDAAEAVEVSPDTPDQADVTLVPTLSCALVTAGGLVTDDVVHLTLADEPAAHAGSPGFQVDVHVGALNVEPGRLATLRVAGVEVATATFAGATVGDGVEVTFIGVTLAHSDTAYELSVSVTNAAGLEGTCTRQVTVDTGLCAAALAPSPAEGCLLADAAPDLPGFQAAFTVTSPSDGCSQVALDVVVGDGMAQQTEPVAVGEGGAATVVVTVSDDEAGLNGLRVQVTGLALSPEHPEKLGANNAQIYRVDTEPPTVQLTAPVAGVLDLASDADGQPANGLQIDVLGSLTGLNPDMLGDTLVLTTTSGTSRTLDEPGASFLFDDVGFDVDGLDVLRVQATDACGLVGAAEVALELFTRRPELAVLEPTEGSVLFSKNDANPASPAYETDVVVQVSELPEGRAVIVQCRPRQGVAPFVEVGRVPMPASASPVAVSVPVSLDVGALTSDVACLATHEYPNASASPARSFTLAMPAPVLTVERPAEGRVTRKDSLTLEVVAEHLDGRPIDLAITRSADGVVVAEVPAFATVLNGGFAGPVDISALADGAYVLALDGSDGFGNVLSEQPGADLHRTFVIDRTAPTVTLVAPAGLGFDDVQDPDQDAARPGYQNTLSFLVAGEASPVGTTLCVSVNGQGAVCAVVTSPDGVVAVPGLSFLAGSNPVLAIATDVAGNPSEAGSWVLVRTSPTPRVEFVQPPHDVSVAIPALAVLVKVTNGVTGDAYDAAAVALIRDGVEVASAGSGAFGVYSLAVTLDEGRNTLQARALVGGEVGFSYPLVVTYKTGVPSAAFEAPVDGAVFHATSPECAAGAGACLTEVRATTTNAEDGSPALLSVLCGATQTTYPASVTAGTLRFEDVVLADQSTCVLSIELVDALGTEAQAGPVVVSVDRVRPRLVAHDVPAYVLKKHDVDPLADGVQVRVRLTLAGFEAGRPITLAVTDHAGLTSTVTLTNPGAVPDSTTDTRVFDAVSLPEGSCSLVFTGTDLAGNAATPLTGAAFVVGSQPRVWVYQPEYVADAACSLDAECGPGACVDGRCYLLWGKASVRAVQVGSQGIPRGSDLGDTVRVCSSDAPAGAAPCQTAGYRVVAADALVEDFFGVNLGSLPDGTHKLIVEALGDPAADLWVTSEDASIDADRRYRLIFQDTVAPETTAVAVSSDTDDPAGVLNKAERPVDGRFAVVVEGTEDGTAELFVDGLRVAEEPVSGGIAHFAVPLDEGPATLQARVSDRVGNQGAVGAEVLVTVDTVAPLLQFANPVEAVLNALDSADAVVRADEAGVRVELLDGATSLGTIPTGSDFRATFPDALLADGTYVFTAVGTDGAENATTVTPPFASVLVDREPPSLTVQQPADLAVLDDADPALGFQVRSVVATAGAVTRRVFLSRGCNPSFTTCGAPALVVDAPVTNPGGPEPVDLLTLPGSSTVHYLLTFEAEDVHGNVATVLRRVTMNVTGCVVAFANLPDSGYVNTSYCLPAGSDCSGVTTDLVVTYLGDCPGVTTLQLRQNGATVATLPAVDGHAIFTGRTWADGLDLALEVRALAGASEVASSGVLALIVDLTAPVVSFVASDVLGFTTPATGDAPTYGLADDQDGGLPDLQIHAVVRTADDHLEGGTLDRLETARDGVTTVVDAQSPAFPEPFGPSPDDVAVLGLTLAHGTQTLTAVAVDAAGNEGRASLDLEVDLQPPSPVTLAALQADETDRRLPRVMLRWTAPGDDGDLGLAVAYDVRFSRGAITDDASFDEACPAADITALEPLAVPRAPGQAEALELRGPDVRPAPSDTDPARCKFVVGQAGLVYTFAVRAIDDAGNRSPFDAGQVASTDALTLRSARLQFTGPLQDEKMDRLFTPLGDVNGDGLADLTTYSNTLGKACVVLGRNDGTAAQDVPDLAFATDVSATHRCFAADTGTSYVGVTAAGLGDIDGDGVGDWAMGYGSTPERVDVFLGLAEAPAADQPAIAAAPFLRLRGQAYAATPSASQVFQVGDFDGDGLADLGIGSRLTNVFYLVLLDRSFTQEAPPRWQPGDGPLELDLKTPATYGAARVVRVTLTGWTDSTTYFGMNAARAGNMLPQPGDDATPPEEVAIYQQNSPNQVFLLKGRAVPTSPLDLFVSAAYNGSAANNLEVVRFWREVGTTEGLFGIDLSGGADLDGGGIPDLVIGHYSQAQKHPDKPYAAYILYGEAIQGELGIHLNGVDLPNPVPPALGEGVLVGKYGVILQGPYRRPAILGDFDGATDGAADLLLHDLSATAWGAVWVRLNGVDAAASIPRGTFPYVDVTLTSPYPDEPAAAYGNTAFPLSDFNGDGFPDILIGVKGGGFPTIVY